jgi:uncharacterized protein (TIGR02117 family)
LVARIKVVIGQCFITDETKLTKLTFRPGALLRVLFFYPMQSCLIKLVSKSMGKWIVKLLTTLLWATGMLCVATALFFVTAVILSSIPVNSSFAEPSDKSKIKVYVTSNGVHTDIVVPVVTPYIDWRNRLPLSHFGNVDSSYTYLSIGWGDKRFYIQTPEWKDLTPEVAITAALWPTKSAIHVEYLKFELLPTQNQRPIWLSADQYQKLIKYIDASFQQYNGHYVLIKNAGYSHTDAFYEAESKFYILNNCNNWVNGGLKAVEVKTALWAPLPFAIMRYLR